jgi:leader peptidase (prepilin peptidase)/N-methyltransferase
MDAGFAAALLLALAGLVGGLAGPGLIARIPEPVPDPEPDPVESEDSDEVEERREKELYRDLAALPGLRWWLAAAGVVAGGLIGARIGWHGALLPWALLVPLGLVLAVVDARTRLLPTWLIGPAYGVMVVLVLLAALCDRSPGHLLGAVIGWLGLGGFFFLLWLVYPKGMGYGDVRLAGLLGLALGYLGWEQLVVGAYAGVLIGGFGGALLKAMRVLRERTVPFGPCLVVGSFLGALVGAQLISGLGY